MEESCRAHTKQIAEHEISIKHLEGRMKKAEETINEIRNLNVSVAKMAANMDSMLAEQRKQSERLEKLEVVPTQNWQNLVRGIVTGIVGIIIGYIFTQIGF